MRLGSLSWESLSGACHGPLAPAAVSGDPQPKPSLMWCVPRTSHLLLTCMWEYDNRHLALWTLACGKTPQEM